MNKFLLILATLLVSGCVTSSMNGTKLQMQKGFLGLSEKAGIDVDTPKAFAGKKDVVVGSFKVGFVTYNKSSQKAGGGLMGGMAGRATARTTLSGISDAQMQKITDAAYKDFLAQLKAQGYNVVDRAKLTSSPEYAKAKALPSPTEIDNSPLALGSDIKVFAPSGQKVMFGLGEGGPTAWGNSNPGMAFANYATKTGLPVISANYLVNFANADGHGGSFKSTAAVNVGQGISVVPGSGVQFIGGQTGTFSSAIGAVKLGQPVYSDSAFATVREMTTGGEKALGYAANAFSLALGGGSSISREYEIAADPAKYTSITTGVLSGANKAVAGAMAANR